jgi:1-acyl-sn-glycerol-3-phosphate acyltransferase
VSHPTDEPIVREPGLDALTRDAMGDDDKPDLPALGSDPFAEISNTVDPFLEALTLLGQPVTAAAPARSITEPLLRDLTADVTSMPEAAGDPAAARPAEPRPPRPLHLERWQGNPPLCEVDVPEPEDLFDRLLGPDERQRLASLAHMVSGDTPYDRYGLSTVALKRTLPIFLALYRAWFRVRSEGHDNIPTHGPALIASNHGGLLPFDGAMLVVDILMNTDPPRLTRAITDRWAGGLPWVNIFFARVGQIVGTRQNFADLLGDGQLVLVFPEGMEGVRKLVTQRYRLQPFHVGFVEQALRARAPVIPTAVIGSDDQNPVLFDVKPLAKALGLPFAPITPTFPWLGPAGLLPLPVGYHIVYGEPLNFHERYGPEDAEDPRLVRYLARSVRRSIQGLIDRHH